MVSVAGAERGTGPAGILGPVNPRKAEGGRRKKGGHPVRERQRAEDKRRPAKGGGHETEGGSRGRVASAAPRTHSVRAGYPSRVDSDAGPGRPRGRWAIDRQLDCLLVNSPRMSACPDRRQAPAQWHPGPQRRHPGFVTRVGMGYLVEHVTMGHGPRVAGRPVARIVKQIVTAVSTHTSAFDLTGGPR